MTAAEPTLDRAGDQDRWAPLVVALTTAALLAFAALAIGANSNGTRPGLIEALTVLVTTAIFGRAAYNGTLPRPFNASAGLLFVVLFGGLTALSVGWSIVPNASMLGALRIISYGCVLALAGLIAQTQQQRAREIALGVAFGALIISLYALCSRVFPGLYPSTDDFARLRLPFGYWNAVGSVAAIGFVLALWAGTRARESRTVEIASFPAGGLLFAALMLSQSRAALLALVVGLGIWLLIVPRRLRSAAWLLAVAAVAGVLVAWAYSRPGLTTDQLPLAVRQSIGWKLLVGLLLMSLVLGAAGWWIRRRRLDRPLTGEARRGVGKLMLILLAISPFVLAALIAVGTNRGLATITDAPKDLFTTSATAPSNSPSRLTQTNSLRGRYWSEAWKIFNDHTLHGTGGDTFGVARLPYRQDLLYAAHAHGMVPQVAGDLGVLGLLILLGLTIAWLIAALRLAGASRRAPWRWLDNADDVRLASVALMVSAIVFGVHSGLDWVWFLPGVAYFGLVGAGWTLGTPAAHAVAVAGGPVQSPVRGGRLQIVRAAAIGLAGLLIAYGVYQPVRAARKVESGLALAQSEPTKAIVLARDAIKLDSTSADGYMLLATAQNNAGQQKAAQGTLIALTTRQPGNPATWLRLAQFRLTTLDDPDGAIDALRPVFYISRYDTQAAALLAAARQEKANVQLRKLAAKKRKQLEKQLKQLEELQKRTVPTGPPAA